MNLKTKTNTVKQILSKVMLLIMLLVYLLNLSACRDPNCVKGDFYALSIIPSYSKNVIKVVAKTNYFALNNIKFDLYIGLKESKGFLSTLKMNDVSQNDLHVVDKETKESYYVLAVTTDDVYYAYDKNSDFYQYIYDNMTILKEISVRDEEKFPYVKKWNGKDISYSESITIPNDLIKKEDGQIILILGKVFEVEGNYFVKYYDTLEIKLEYIIDQKHMIRLSFIGYERY